MNEKFNKLKEIYNSRQDDYTLVQEHGINNKPIMIFKLFKSEYNFDVAGFYEWLFHPKYKTLEVFRLNTSIKLCISNGFFSYGIDYSFKTNQPEEIIDYIYKELNNGN